MCRALLIGESWGRSEKLFEHAFVGPSGRELAMMLGEAGLASSPAVKFPSELEMVKHWQRLREAEGIEIANVFDEHPESNNTELFFASRTSGLSIRTDLPPFKLGKYVLAEHYHHVEKLWKRIDELKPTLILPLGNYACWAVLGEAKISAIRGTVKIAPKFSTKTLPTYHPSAVLHDYRLRTIVLKDFIKATREMQFKEIRRVERFATVADTLDEIVEWGHRPAEFYSVDVETWVPPLSIIGFARSPHDALVIPFYDDRKENKSHWTIQEEAQVLRLVDMLLRKPLPKVFQNGVFDLWHLLRLGMRPTMCNDDTMLLHHALYPEMLKGLGFLGSIYSDEIAWKPMANKTNKYKRDE
jgi:uracil-DNA glycosylase